MTSVPPTQPPAAPKTDVRLTDAERVALTRCDCGHDIGGEHNSYGCYGGGPACGCNETDDRPGVNFAAVERIVAERVRVVEGERDAALAGSDSRAERITRGLGGEVTRARTQRDLATARAESAEAAHAALVAAVEALADEWEQDADGVDLGREGFDGVVNLTHRGTLLDAIDDLRALTREG